MKKSLLFLAAAMMSAASFAQGVTVTPAEDNNGDPSFKFSTDESYVSIFLGDETRVTMGLPDANYIYLGPDPDNGRNLWPWSETYTWPEKTDLNSFGIPGDYMSVQVAEGATWSGLGYNISKDFPINLSFIDSDWAFHLAVKTQYTGPIMFTIHDGTTEAQLVFGEDGSTYDDHAAIANFPRDGEWYNIDIPMSYLEDQFEFTFAGATKYADKNYFVVCCGPYSGKAIDYDAVFFHGPKVDPGIVDGIRTINNDRANGQLFDLAGRRVEKATRGIFIQNGRKFVK